MNCEKMKNKIKNKKDTILDTKLMKNILLLLIYEKN